MDLQVCNRAMSCCLGNARQRLLESKQLYNTIREYSEQIKRFTNQLHSLQLLPVPSKDTIKSLEKMKQALHKEMTVLEGKLHDLLQKWQPEKLKSVISIKGIGKRAAAMLIVFTQAFKYTNNHRQLISFAGLSPTQYTSGTSIQGKSRIYKKGGKNLQDVLYMCSMNAIKTNSLQNPLRATTSQRQNRKTGINCSLQ
jgi:transposase